MQRNTPPSNRKNVYVRSGVPAYQTPGGKKRRKSPRIVRTIIFAAVILAVIVAAAYGLTQIFGNAGKPVRINARPADNIQPFGENVVFYDGLTLHCANKNGNTAWQYALGTDGDFYCGKNMIVAWTGHQLIIFNKEGQATYTDRMDEPILFARVGEAYVAVCVGASDLASSVRIMTHTGSLIEPISFPDFYILDIGFFSTREQLMWVLALDINGNAPITKLSTYEPGKLSTGAVELQDQLVYGVYLHNNNLMVVDTTKIRTFNYKCVEQTDLATILSYGWQVKDVRSMNRNTYALMEQMPSSGSLTSFSELRLITNYQVQSLRLLSPCFASGLSDKGVYGFAANTIYFAPYGSNAFKATNLNYTISDLICTLDGSRAVIATGDDVFIIQLPTS